MSAPVIVVSCGDCHGRGTTVHGDRPCRSCKGSGKIETDVRRLAPRMIRILWLLEEVAEAMPAGEIAHRLDERHSEHGGWGRNGACNGMRRMSTATIVTPAITALRRRGLIHHAPRLDDMSGSADRITGPGRLALELLRDLGYDVEKGEPR